MQNAPNALRAGIIAAQTGRNDEARDFFLQAVKAAPRHEIAWLWLSSVMATTEQAVKCLDHLLTINPNNPQAHEAKSILQVRQLLEEASFVQERQAGQTQRGLNKASFRLGDLLVEQQVLTQGQLDMALGEQQRLARLGRPTRLGEVLLSTKLIRREQLAAALRAQIEAVKNQQAQNGVASLGQSLVSRGYITAEQLAHALSIQSAGTKQGQTPKLGDILIRHRYLTPSQLERVLAEQSQEYQAQFR